MAFPATFSLDNLDGLNGFRLDGIAEGDGSGAAVASAGDINGDGIGDFIIGAPRADTEGDDPEALLLADTGQAYIVFGRTGGFDPDLQLADLDGTNGFRIDGLAPGAKTGHSVAGAGDFNGDGIADFIVGAPSDPGTSSGDSYIVFGTTEGFAPVLDLAALDGSDGFRIEEDRGRNQNGASVSAAGDVNGDGFADVVIGVPFADFTGGNSGGATVLFGTANGFSGHFQLSQIDGTNGFDIRGASVGDSAGTWVASAGDFNGDGFADVIVGSFLGNPGGLDRAGEAYVIFGKAEGFPEQIASADLDGTDGFRLPGLTAEDRTGAVASAGDVNGDGFDDLIVGASGARAGANNQAGVTYVVFGRASGLGAEFDYTTLDGTNGFRIEGLAEGDRAGIAVAGAGDVNGDGFADVVIGAQGVGTDQGAVYVVFGKAGGFGATVDLAALDGTDGFRLDGVGPDDFAGAALAMGDVNGDGFADVIVGSLGGDPDGRDGAGESYVFFGLAPDEAVVRVGSGASQTILGGAFDDTLRGLGGADMLKGGAGDDVLNGGGGDDLLDGGADNDVLDGRSGADTMTGGAGDDFYFVESAGDAVIELGGEGIDRVQARIDYTLADHVENLTLKGPLAQSGTGNGLANVLRGTAGDNTLSGLTGVDELFGNDGDDMLLGGAGGDRLEGSAGRDTINGGTGDDVIVGGANKDTLFGGDGADTFFFDDGEVGGGASSADIVLDFGQVEGDKVHVRRIDADTGTGGDQNFTFIGDGAFTGVAGQLHYVHAGPNTFVEGDTDGDGAADFVIRLDGLHNLVAGDFVL